MKKLVSILTLFVTLLFTANLVAQKATDRKASKDSVTISSNELSKLTQNLDSIEKVVKTNSKVIQEKPKPFTSDQYFSVLILVFITAMVLVLLYRANQSRKDMLTRADKEGDIMELTNYLMKQTLGLPHGSIRGIIALVIATTFVASIFYYGNFNDIPDSFKIIVSLVFGYYFSKKEDQTKAVMDAMLGKTKQQALKKQEARAALAEAKACGAEKHAEELLKKASDTIDKATNTQRASEAISLYNEAIKLAHDACDKAKTNKQETDRVKNLESRKEYDDLLIEVNHRIGNLREIKTTPNTISLLEELVRSANANAQNNDYSKAVTTLNRAKDRIDTLLEDYDEAEKQFNSLQEEKQNKLKETLNDVLSSFNTSFVNDIPGDNTDLIESLVRMQAQVKEQDQNLVPLFRKRVLGETVTDSDIEKIYADIKNRGDKNILKSIFESAANHLGTKLTDNIRDAIDLPENIEKLLLGSAEDKSNIFKDIFEKNGISDKSIFDKLLAKAKEGLIDATIGDDMKKALPEGINYSSVHQLIDGAQKDKDQKGILSKLEKILDVGETILSFTPIGGYAKTASVMIKGIFKIFGKNKNKKK